MAYDSRLAIPVIVGPTASGKSAIGVALALRLERARGVKGVVIAADSMQVYRGLDIGTAKPTVAERCGVEHRMIDLVEPVEAFSVDAWLEGAEAEIARARAAAGAPMVVGGTHLYIKALLEGMFEGPEPDAALRAELTAMDAGARRAELERVDAAAAARIHPNDVRRTVRALEVFRQTGTPISVLQSQWDGGRVRADCVLVVVEWPVEALNRRINARVKGMMEAGLLEETRALWEAGRLGMQAREGLGYKQLVAHLEGRCTLVEAVEAIKIETRRFAKNQRTWLRRLSARPPGGGLVRIDGERIGADEAAQLVEQQMFR
ncbi:MAG: tRNA (adenosine(37)-N6)-dimethylallyltransferase MiaA [Phycisphaeraceae bacterium]|nr:tRNA (adenosine(37)-N6)-dimethylallyltransferase MiaA [Phycisphaeraceae bacterium]